MKNAVHAKNHHAHLSHPKYRADIDGLRAIAIIAVVWFHAYPSSLRSGFIGVDVFFVISGFLISSIIFSNLEKGTFSFTDFYIRRIRRILPALVTVMLTSFIFGWFALTAEEYQELGKHIAGGATFVSNFILWSESGYFDHAAETKPMLHLWSLAIEEQFYIFWPILLALVWKNHNNFLKAVAIIGIISFATSIYLIGHDKPGAFYSPVARFWELMAGSALAYITMHRPEINSHYRNQQSIVGFLLLVIGMIFIDRWHLFPGWWVLLPVFGTCLMISAGPKALINRTILSHKYLVWIGLISFPLYLWHWPLLSFMKILRSDHLSVGLSLSAVIISVILAFLTFKYIEHPCRFNKHKFISSGILLFLLFATGASGYLAYINHGLEFRKSAPKLHEVNYGAIGHAAYLQQLNEFYPCDSDQIQKAAMAGGCLQSHKTGKPHIAIIGDSHAQHLYLGIAKTARNSNIFMFMQNGIPTLDDKNFSPALRYAIETPSISKVVLTAFWSWRIRNSVQRDKFKESLKKTVIALTSAHKSVYIIAADVPHFSFEPAKCKYSGRLGLGLGSINQCSESSASFYNEKSTFEKLIRQSTMPNKRVKLIDLSKYFCNSDQCYMAKKGILFYRDRNHLNANGSMYIGPKIVESLSIQDTTNNPKRINTSTQAK